MATVFTPMGTGLHFAGMSDYGIKHGFDLQYTSNDPSAKVFLCVGTEENRVEITGTNRLSRQAAVLKAIDDHGKWAQNIELWMVAEKNGALAARTGKVTHRSHVKPYYGKLTISDISADKALTYPGNGLGRLLSDQINGRYYMIYGGKLETSNAMRGFDCTSFPMALLSTGALAPPGYGKQLWDKAGATKCDLEQLNRDDLEARFRENSIPVGQYVVFSAGHVLLYDSDINTLYEFNGP